MADLGDRLGASGRNFDGKGTPDQEHDLRRELKELSQETIELVRQELQLVKAELSEKTEFIKEQVQLTATQARHEVEHAKADLATAGRKAGVGAGMFGGATLLGLGAFAAFTAFLIAGVAALVPVWAAALIVALVYGAGAGGLALAGRNRVKQVGAPIPETIGRFKNLISFRSRRIKGELSEIPQHALGTLGSVKDDVREAWQKGSHQHGSLR